MGIHAFIRLLLRLIAFVEQLERLELIWIGVRCWGAHASTRFTASCLWDRSSNGPAILTLAQEIGKLDLRVNVLLQVFLRHLRDVDAALEHLGFAISILCLHLHLFDSLIDGNIVLANSRLLLELRDHFNSAGSVLPRPVFILIAPGVRGFLTRLDNVEAAGVPMPVRCGLL